MAEKNPNPVPENETPAQRAAREARERGAASPPIPPANETKAEREAREARERKVREQDQS